MGEGLLIIRVHNDRLVSRREPYGYSCLAAPPSGLVRENPIVFAIIIRLLILNFVHS